MENKIINNDPAVLEKLNAEIKSKDYFLDKGIQSLEDIRTKNNQDVKISTEIPGYMVALLKDSENMVVRVVQIGICGTSVVINDYVMGYKTLQDAVAFLNMR